MKISLKSEKAYQGGIYSGRFTLVNDSGMNYDYITCCVKGTIYTPGYKIVIFESVYKILEFDNNEAILKFVIPKETPPSLVDEKHQIRYKIMLSVYTGLEKKIISFPFTIGSSYIYDMDLLYKIILDEDMIRLNNSLNTPFQSVIDRMRKLNLEKIDINEPLIDLLNRRIIEIRKFDILNEVKRTRKDGDIWFYCDNQIMTIENKKYSIDIHLEDKIFANVLYYKFVKDLLLLEIFFYSEVSEIKIEFIKKINEELDTNIDLYKDNVKGYIYKSFEVRLPDDIGFTFRSNHFEVSFSLFIRLDELSFKIPVVILNRDSNINISYDDR